MSQMLLPSARYRSLSVFSDTVLHQSFLCGFEIEPNAHRLWEISAEQKAGTLTLLQLRLLEQRIVIRQIAAFSRHPGVVTVYRGDPVHEAMSYSLGPLTYKWPDPIGCSFCEIDKGGLGLAVQYENGIQATPGEQVLIVLGGTFL